MATQTDDLVHRTTMDLTERSRKVLELAQGEAQRFNHSDSTFGPEHLLLGLVKEGSGVAAMVLKNLACDLRTIRLAVTRVTDNYPATSQLANNQFPAEIVVAAATEAQACGDSVIGTEHLLLALAVSDSRWYTLIGSVVLGVLFDEMRTTAQQVRLETLALLGKSQSDASVKAPAQTVPKVTQVHLSFTLAELRLLYHGMSHLHTDSAKCALETVGNNVERLMRHQCEQSELLMDRLAGAIMPLLERTTPAVRPGIAD